MYVVGSLEWGNTFPAPSVPIFARLFPNGERDPSFNPPTPVDLEAWAGVAIQDDGRILAFGGTGSVSAPSHLARYHPDGSLDGSFSLSPSAGIINTRPLRIAPDGKIILSQSNGTSYASLIRLNSNGSLDSSFNPTSAWISDAGKQPTLINFITAPTGKIYSGSFFDQVQGISTKKIVAFEGNTTADTISWASLDPEIVESAGTLYLALRRAGSAATPGSITVTASTGSAGASDFTSLAATASWGATSGIIYVPISLTDDSDIEGDETFTVTLSAASGASLSGPASITVTLIDDETAPVILTHPVSISVKEGESATFSVAVDSPIPPTYQWYKNGGIIAGATSSSYTITTSSPSDAASYTVTVAIPGFSVNSNPATLTVIPPAAVVDATFVPDSGLEPFTLTILPDGSIIIYEGNFSAGYTLRKLDPSGVLDPTFSPTIVPLSGFTNINPTLFPLPSGQILITGFFESTNGVSRPQVALLNADRSIDPTFDVGLPNNTAIAYSSGAAVTASGEIYLHYRENGTAGAIHRRLLDGSIDPTFTTSIGSGLNGRLRSLIELPD
ncbi:immunoglobulin domain-containing protein [Akkermansiaceae bacterium]|nr:immunoglobulin domain-containing protein [Akkermansiaceae bacterium]